MTPDTQIRSIGVVGTGVVGASLAAFFAARGLEVHLYDENHRARRTAVQWALHAVEQTGKAGLASADAAETSGDRLAAHATLAGALKDVQLVQESVAENRGVKQPVFARLDELTPERTAGQQLIGSSDDRDPAKPLEMLKVIYRKSAV